MENGNEVLKSFKNRPVLIKVVDKINWKRKMYSFLWRDNPKLTALSEKSAEGTSEEMEKWLKKSPKAKSNIILCRDSSKTSGTRHTIDENEKHLRMFWSIYIVTSTQSL